MLGMEINLQLRSERHRGGARCWRRSFSFRPPINFLDAQLAALQLGAPDLLDFILQQHYVWFVFERGRRHSMRVIAYTYSVTTATASSFSAVAAYEDKHDTRCGKKTDCGSFYTV